MNISKSMVESFYYTCRSKGKNQYRNYTFKYNNRGDELLLLKNKRKLASWFVEKDEIIIHGNEKSNAEKQFVKKFKALPQKAEELYQHLKEQKKLTIQRKKEVEERIEQQYYRELNEYCSNLKDDELTSEIIDRVIGHFASQYMDIWYVVGVHPDRYDDNFGWYLSNAKARVKGTLSSVQDPRFQKLLRENHLIDNTKAEIPWSKLSDEEVLQYTYVTPVYAQREGNLVTITDLDEKRFEKLVAEARQYAVNLVKVNPKKYLEDVEFTVYWWEKEGDFSLPEPEIKEEHQSLREEMLYIPPQKTKTIVKPNPQNPKSKAKPSRLQVKVEYLRDGEEKTLWQIHYQKGVIKWE